MKICTKCNKELDDEAKFCIACGMEVKNDLAEQTEKKPLKKIWIFAGLGAVIFVVVFIIIIKNNIESENINGAKKIENNNVLYIKDQELFFSNLKEDSEAWQLTSHFVDSEELEETFLVDSEFGNEFFMSEGGKYIFFTDYIDDEDEYGMNLYYRELNKPEVEAVKIDSNIVSYTVNTSATIVTYTKSDEENQYNLYRYTLVEDSKEKVSGEVRSFYVSDDGSKLIYINTEGNVYLKCDNKDKEKIASDVYDGLAYVSDDLKVVYYIKDGSLYKQIEGEDKIKIATDVEYVLKCYDSGEVYYVKSEKGYLMDYITDDMKTADAHITEPEYPNYPSCPSQWNYDTYTEYTTAYEAYKEEYERLRTEYEAAYEAYEAKRYRDSLRESLAENTWFNAPLCFFNGTEEVVIADNFSVNVGCAADAPVILYKADNRSDLAMVKISEVEDIESAYDKVRVECFDYEQYIAIKGVVTVVEQQKQACQFKINASGTTVYYIDNMPDGENYGELYRISISNGVVGKAEVYDSDVYAYASAFVDKEQFIYFKNYKNLKGELYIDKNKIDYDVFLYNVSVDSDSEKILYFTDWNLEKYYGTLKVYQGGESVEIADDVHDYSVIPDGRVLYLYDYSLKYYKGELHEWNKGETRKIDDDVVRIIKIDENKYRHNFSGGIGDM